MSTPWRELARPGQLPPNQGWMTWTIKGGRGSGKSKAAGEAIKEMIGRHARNVSDTPFLRIACLGRTLDEVRTDMMESTLLPILGDLVHIYNHSDATIKTSAAVISGYGADKPSRLRGPLFHYGWVDHPETFPRFPPDGPTPPVEMLRFGLRLGDQPQLIITTKPDDPTEVTTVL